MYRIVKRLEIAGAHYLNLPYESKCTNLHGHNWIIHVELSSRKLNKNGMVMDFKHIKNRIENFFDHSVINKKLEELGFEDVNPTAENLAKIIADLLTGQFDGIEVVCTKCSVEESPNNTAVFEREDF